MRKSLVTLPLALVLVACGGEKQPESPAGASDMQKPAMDAPSVAMKTITLDVTGMTWAQMCTAAVSGMLKGAGASDVGCEVKDGKPTGKVTCKVPADADLGKITGAIKGRYSATVQ